MRLQLVKQGDFLGTKCDFYVNETGDIFMSRTQIGYALKYKNPSKGIEDIHNRHHDRLDTMSVKVDPPQFAGVKSTLQEWRKSLYVSRKRNIRNL